MESPASQSNATSTRPSTLSRIRFPGDTGSADKLAKAPLHDRSEKSRSPSLLTPASLGNGHTVRGDDYTSQRRRVRSVHATSALSHANSPHANNIRGTQRRVVSHQLRSAATTRARMTSLDSSVYDSQSGHGATTEDNDDPNVIADLQRALKFKGEVVDRLRAAKSNSEVSSPSASSTAAYSSNPYAYKSFGNERSTRVDRDLVDFSPSISKPPLHPVPTSSNDGATLDWSGIHSEDEKRERRWHMSLSRRVSSKDKSSPITRKGVIEQQDSLYAEKIARIRSRAQLQTIRKADITGDQLRRRYAVLEESSKSEKASAHLTDIVRWFNALDRPIKETIDDAEPLTWLRHLHGKGQSPSPRSSWIVTALVAEVFVQAAQGKDITAALMQESSPLDNAPEEKPSRGLPVHVPPARSRPESMQSIEAHPHGRQTPENAVSFEPTTGSRRSSGGNESRNSIDTGMRRWKTSITRFVDSPRSSIVGIVPEDNRRNGRISPMEQRKHISAISMIRSEDESSSAIESSREGVVYDGDKHEQEDQSTSSRQRRQRPFSTSNALLPSLLPKPRIDTEMLETHPDTPRPFKSSSLPLDPTASNQESRPDLSRQKTQPLMPTGSLGPQPPQRWLRRSLPSSVPASLKNTKSSGKRSDVQEQAVNLEYATKRENLEALKAANMRIKQLLSTASKGIAEYDELQSGLCDRLKTSYTPLPKDVLDAFSHDPSAVTGNTRSSKGWRAVEDIHKRITLQRQTLQTFVDALPSVVTSVSLPNEGLYSKSLSTLNGLVEELQSKRKEVKSQVAEFRTMVDRVKELRDQLKPEYEQAGKHTSATYPELAQLESLLDKFVNQRNRLWMIAETSISFALSSFAPLLKTFGRPVWDDLHDFLVIPWYRNDFSGEDEWYPVMFPKRKPTHWLKLFILGLGAPLCLKNGTHLLVSLLTQGYSVYLPFAIPQFAIYALYLFILILLTSALISVFFTVLAEFAIILWWSAWALRIVQ